jgi:osmotically-inducible protein OsmY
MILRSLSFLFILTALSLTVGCGTLSGSTGYSNLHGTATDDADLYQAVTSRLQMDPMLRAEGIIVEVHQGRVRLTGQVSSASIRMHTVNIVRSTRGVTAIYDELIY